MIRLFVIHAVRKPARIPTQCCMHPYTTTATTATCARLFAPPPLPQACPRGTVGVTGVDLQPASTVSGGGQGAAAAAVAAPVASAHRFSCVGAELPMLMRRDGAARVHEVGARPLPPACEIPRV